MRLQVEFVEKNCLKIMTIWYSFKISLMYQPSSTPLLASIVPIPAVSTASMAYAGTTPQVGLALSIAQISILCIEYHCQHNISHQAEDEHTELHFAFTLRLQ